MNSRILVVSNTIDPLYGGPTFSGTNSTVALARAGNEVTFDIVIVRSPWAAASLYQTVLRRLFLSPPMLVVPHESFTDFDIFRTGEVKKRLVKRALGQFIINAASGVVFSSELESEASSRVFKFGSTAVVLHPVEVAEPAAEWKKDDIFTVGYFGRLHRKKNVNTVIEALAHTKSIRLVVGGAGGEEDNLRALSKRLGVDDRIEWLGLVAPSQKEWFFSQCDIIAMPSDFECFGMTLAEAIASGVPVITTKSTGLSKIISNGRCGLIIDKSSEALAEAFSRYSSDKELLKEQKAACRNVKNEFSMEVHGAALKKFIESTRKANTAPQ